MRTSATIVALAGLVILVAGCPKKHAGEGDAAAEAATAAADAAPAIPQPTNADKVARFPDETPIDHQTAATQWPKTNARKAPPSGEIVATLPSGTNVVQIASHDKFVLVTFDDPKNAGQRLMGWVLKDVFTAQPAVRPKSICPPGQTPLVADEHFCAKVCKVDTDCIGGQACMGTAQIALADGGAGETVHNCMGIARPDAGTTATDAGTKPAQQPAADAGGGKGASAAPVLDPTNGACPAGYVLRAELDKKCHKSCKTSADCGGPGVICTRGGFCKTGP